MANPIVQPKNKLIKTQSEYTTQELSGVMINDDVPFNGTWEFSGDPLVQNLDKPKQN
jgi:hypothetical protein